MSEGILLIQSFFFLYATKKDQTMSISFPYFDVNNIEKRNTYINNIDRNEIIKLITSKI
jgi:hypothetical protein